MTGEREAASQVRAYRRTQRLTQSKGSPGRLQEQCQQTRGKQDPTGGCWGAESPQDRKKAERCSPAARSMLCPSAGAGCPGGGDSGNRGQKWAQGDERTRV